MGWLFWSVIGIVAVMALFIVSTFGRKSSFGLRARYLAVAREDRFDLTLDDIGEVLQFHDVTTVAATEIFDHLLTVWPGGIIHYNAWWAVHKARDMGLLDTEFRPNLAAQPINEESRRMLELYQLGGAEAVQAYRKLMQ